MRGARLPTDSAIPLRGRPRSFLPRTPRSVGEHDVGDGLQGPLQRDRRPAPAHDERVGGAEGVSHSEDMLVLWVKMHSRRILHKNALRGFLPRWMYLEMAAVRAMISSLAALFFFFYFILLRCRESSIFFVFPSPIHLQFYLEQYLVIIIDFSSCIYSHLWARITPFPQSVTVQILVDCYCSSPLFPPGIFPSRRSKMSVPSRSNA